MNVEEARVGDNGTVLALTVSGRLDANTSNELENLIAQAVAKGDNRILMDFEPLDYISSAGLRVLLKTARELNAKSGQLMLCCLRDYIREVFELSGFTTIIPVVESLDEGVARLSQS